MKKGKFTQIPDEWWKLCGKHTVIDEETGEVFTESITMTSIVLLAKVYSFNMVRSTDSGYIQGQCTASNGYFAEVLNMKKGTIKNTLSSLYKLRLLKSYEKRDGGFTVQRFLYVNEETLNRMLEEVNSQKQDEELPGSDIAAEEENSGNMVTENVIPQELGHEIITESLGNDGVEQEIQHNQEDGHEIMTEEVTEKVPYSHELITEQSPDNAPNNKEDKNKIKINNIGDAESDDSPSLAPQPPAESSVNPSYVERNTKKRYEQKPLEMVDGVLLHPLLAGEKIPTLIFENIESGKITLEEFVALMRPEEFGETEVSETDDDFMMW